VAWKQRIFVVANVTATSSELIDALKDRTARRPTTFTLILPATTGRADAEATLADVLAHLREQGLEIDGSIGHADPVIAVTEAWDPMHYDEIIISTLPAESSKWLRAGLPRRIENLTGAPVTHVVARPSPPPLPVSTAPVQRRPGVVFDPMSVMGWSTSHEVDTHAPQQPTIAEYEIEQVAEANASGRQPVVFIHGLWLLPSSWERWADVFERAGYVALTPGWPDDPETVQEAMADPGVLPHKTIGQIANHYCVIIDKLEKKPALIGHSIGGLLVQIIAGRGLGAASVAVDPAPFRGVLPLPISALKSARPVLENPANRSRAVPLTYDQFRYAFANAVSEEEAKELYERFVVPASATTLFQTAAANLNPWTEAKVDTENPDRGPLLIISGDRNHAIPSAIAEAAYRRQKRNEGATEIVKIAGRGHSLTIDSGWREVADTALEFVCRFAPPDVQTDRPGNRRQAAYEPTSV
jgi:non-heme chloroperoxidase